MKLNSFFKFKEKINVVLKFWSVECVCLCVCTYIYIYIYKKLVTIVKSNLKAPFSISTTLRCRKGHYSFPWIAPLCPRYIPYIAEC